jgi:hypothetical protein
MIHFAITLHLKYRDKIEIPPSINNLIENVELVIYIFNIKKIID